MVTSDDVRNRSRSRSPLKGGERGNGSTAAFRADRGNGTERMGTGERGTLLAALEYRFASRRRHARLRTQQARTALLRSRARLAAEDRAAERLARLDALRPVLAEALDATGGNLSQVARAVGYSPRHTRRLLVQVGLR